MEGEFDPKGQNPEFLKSLLEERLPRGCYTIHNILYWGSIYRCCFPIAPVVSDSLYLHGLQHTGFLVPYYLLGFAQTHVH